MNWTETAQLAIQVGLALFAVLAVPLAIWQYRRYGRLSVPRMLGLAGLIVYVLAVVGYTAFPMPEHLSTWCETHEKPWQWVPFDFVSDMVRQSQGRGLRGLLGAPALRQAVLNVALFVPMGVLARRYLHWRLGPTLLAGLALSVAIELTQGTAVFGLAPCAWRFADVDDVMLNTLGALVGALLGPVLLGWMPRSRSLVAERLEPRPVTSGRRWAGMALDLAAYAAIIVVPQVAAGLVDLAEADVDAVADVAWWLPLLAWVVVTLIPALAGRGSFGAATVWLRPVWCDQAGRPTPGPVWRRVARAAVVGVPLAAVSLTGDPAALGLLALVGVASIALVPVTATRRSLSGRLTGASYVDARTLLASPR